MPQLRPIGKQAETEIDQATGILKKKGSMVVTGRVNVEAFIEEQVEMAVIKHIARAEGLDPERLTATQISAIRKRIAISPITPRRL
jgi:hypothetical protein